MFTHLLFLDHLNCIYYVELKPHDTDTVTEGDTKLNIIQEQSRLYVETVYSQETR